MSSCHCALSWWAKVQAPGPPWCGYFEQTSQCLVQSAFVSRFGGTAVSEDRAWASWSSCSQWCFQTLLSTCWFSVWIHIWGLPPGYHHLYVGTDSALDLRFSPWWDYILLCFSFRCPSISLSLPLKHSRKRSSFLQVVLVLLSHKSVNPPSPDLWLSCEHFLHKIPSEATSGGFCICEPPAFHWRVWVWGEVTFI